ncbi:MAG: hypothetical protein GX046_06915 [Tissierellia bacterium]|nr:hypothetical protein [Tissierellia bacterium]
MKRNRTLTIVFALLLFLVSCGEKEESGSKEIPKAAVEEISTEQTPPKEEVQPAAPVVEVQPTVPLEETKSEEEVKESPVSEDLSALGKKMVKAEEELNSMKTTGTFEVITDIKEMGEFAIVMDLETIFVKEPFFVHTKTISKALEGSSVPFFNVDLEFYQEKTQMWTKNSMFGETWVRVGVESEDFDSYDQFSYGQSPASIYGENFDLFDVEKKGSDYLLTLTGDDEDWADIIKTIFQNDPQLQEDQDEVKIRSLFVEILVDGSSYFPKEFRIDMEFTIVGEEEEEDVQIKQKGFFLYSDYNSYSDMKVPQEVIDSVQR